MERIVLSYFDNQFRTSQVEDDEEIIGAVDRLVTDEMATSMSEDFSEVEIKATIFDMHPSKSLARMDFRHYSFRNIGIPLGKTFLWLSNISSLLGRR